MKTQQAPKILIIDDEKPMHKLLGICLDGYGIVSALSAEEGLQKTAFEHPDLILLDINLPDKSGFEVLTHLREWSRTPVIILSVVGHEQEKIRYLDAGADDFVTKPFLAGELLARIRVALRHQTPPDEEVFKSRWLEVDFVRRIVKVSGQQVKLTRIEYNILSLLARNAGKVVTQTQIMREVWKPGMENETNLLRVHIAYLRRKIEPQSDKPELLITEPAVGYRLMVLPAD